MNGPYDDIINLPHHVSNIHPQMPLEKRAAQFAPFSALTGYDAAIKKTARLTVGRVELEEDAIAELDMKLKMLKDSAKELPQVTVTYFIPDETKDGGKYVTVMGAAKRVDEYEKALVMKNGAKIAIEDVWDIECELFRDI